jgi:hypothetical protein
MKMDTVSTKLLSRSPEPLPCPTDLETRAAEALAALLRRISAIKLIELKREFEMKRESWPRGPYSGIPARRVQAHPIQTSPILAHRILAHIDVYGHSHTLACEVYSDGDPVRLREAFHENQRVAQPISSDATPVLIAPYLSPEAQDLCKGCKSGFLDFEGNARLIVGEVFIVMRSLPGRATAQQSAAVRTWPARSAPVARTFSREIYIPA